MNKKIILSLPYDFYKNHFLYKFKKQNFYNIIFEKDYFCNFYINICNVDININEIKLIFKLYFIIII